MDVASEETIKRNLEILPLETKKAFLFLSEKEWLSEELSWYLAGGTALALQVGHRQSVDLDFFNTGRNINNNEILNNFSEKDDWEPFINKKNTVYGKLLGAKISFIAYPFFVPKQKFVQYGSINILNPLDIAVMKIIAISQRGTKRDFFDLFWCAKNIESLENLVIKLKAQYPAVAHNYHHIIKSLTYFADAEEDPDPKIYFKAIWKEIKNFFEKEVPVVAKKLINLK